MSNNKDKKEKLANKWDAIIILQKKIVEADGLKSALKETIRHPSVACIADRVAYERVAEEARTARELLEELL